MTSEPEVSENLDPEPPSVSHPTLFPPAPALFSVAYPTTATSPRTLPLQSIHLSVPSSSLGFLLPRVSYLFMALLSLIPCEFHFFFLNSLVCHSPVVKGLAYFLLIHLLVALCGRKRNCIYGVLVFQFYLGL